MDTECTTWTQDENGWRTKVFAHDTEKLWRKSQVTRATRGVVSSQSWRSKFYKNVLYSESLDFVTTVLSFRQQQRPDKTSQNNNIPETSAPQEFDRNLNLSSKVYTLTNGTVVASKVYDVWLFARGLVEDIRTFCLGQIHPTYSEKLSWKFAWNVKMIIDAVDPHRRPGTKAQKVEMFVGCESLPYKVSGHIFWPFKGRKWRARLTTFHNMNWQDSLAFYILLKNPIKDVNQSNDPHNALLECQAGLWHGHKFASPQFFRRIPRPDFPKVLFGHDGISRFPV